MRFFFGLILCFFLVSANAQPAPHQPGSSEIKQRLRKLNFLGSVLYVAAHPDDENTRAIAYLVNDQLAATAYLSMTRGDGGQNLIGSEFRDLLGLIRTQELLAARRIDGGTQYFTRANDFGFSKSAKETFEIWNKDEILSDVVSVIRQFQPDVILTRFPPDERAGHGHHTASAILAQEAFELSAAAGYHPEQIVKFGAWQPTRLLTNTGRWWNDKINASTPGVVTMNVGAYNPLLGKSSSEIAATSRTQHKSQGFGSPGRRGDAPEYFENMKGEKAVKSIFDGVNTTWKRIKGAERIPELVDQAVKNFNDDDPGATLSWLTIIRSMIQKLEPSVWRERKLNEINQLMQDCLGLYVDVSASQYWNAPGQSLVSGFEIINRSKSSATLQRITSPLLQYDSTFTLPLKYNELSSFKTTRILADTAAYSDPYWLRSPHGQGLFVVPGQRFIGKPENDPAIQFTFEFQLQTGPFSLTVPLVYKWTDPVKGELIRPAEIVPPVTVNLDKSVYLFRSAQPEDVGVLVKSSSGDPVKGELKLDLPSGWKSEPSSYAFDLRQRGEEQRYRFKVMAGAAELTTSIKAFADIGGKRYDHSLKTIQYDHIPVQTLLPPSSSKALRIDLRKEGGVIAYIRGAGDDVPESLRNMGYQVWEMKDDEVTATNLKTVDAVVLGIRALNTNDRVRYFMPTLLTYVKEGGTLVVQYNVNQGLEIEGDKFAPYPITLSRDRVTEEKSTMRILLPASSVLNYPNKITSRDFDNWVQERGLYYPARWDAQYEAPLSANDTGETAKDGGLLIANYGSGKYVYTGLSFFRQLPEGVPGAYKLFANLVSAGKQKPMVAPVVKKP